MCNLLWFIIGGISGVVVMCIVGCCRGGDSG